MFLKIGPVAVFKFVQYSTVSAPHRGILPRRPTHADYKKNLDAPATAVEEHPFNMHRAASYLRQWNAGTLQQSPPLDTSFLLSPGNAARSASSQGQGLGSRAMSVQPEAVEVRVVNQGLARGAIPAATPRVVFKAKLARELKRQGNSWQDAFRIATNLWNGMGRSLTNALASEGLGIKSPAMFLVASTNSSTLCLFCTARRRASRRA